MKLVITTAVEHMPAERRSGAALAGGLLLQRRFPNSPACSTVSHHLPCVHTLNARL